MNGRSYNYDVALSFLAQDERLATELNDLLQDRLKTFLYSKRQGEIAGTDGEQTFNKVFGEEARVVVVLCRDPDVAHRNVLIPPERFSQGLHIRLLPVFALAFHQTGDEIGVCFTVGGYN